MVVPYVSNEVLLDTEMRGPEVMDFERKLKDKIVGQDWAAARFVNMYQICMANMSAPGRPIGNLLFLGPTGSGKTRIVEAAAEILFGNSQSFIKIDCAEFQHSHEIAKLIGSPPGYIGHRETQPVLRQETIDMYQTEKARLTFVLFDEIEKASDSLWQLLLGILDKAVLTLGDGNKVDLSRCIVVMTSNLGAFEIQKMMTGGIGFNRASTRTDEALADIDRRIYRTASEVAKRKFSPKFMNRIDKVVVFRTLNPAQLRQVLDIELGDVQRRITASLPNRLFILQCTEAAKEFLLSEGTDLKFGARHLKRAIERYVVYPLSNLIATGQINLGDIVKIDRTAESKRLIFSKERMVTALCTVESGNAMLQQAAQV